MAVEVTLEVYEFLDRADHKTENLFHEQRRHWDGREFDEYIITTEGVGAYGETPEEYLPVPAHLEIDRFPDDIGIETLHLRLHGITVGRWRGDAGKIPGPHQGEL